MNRRILVYENDLKFKTYKNINFDNKNLILHSGDINKNYDTIIYRLEESKKNNNTFLDLSELQLINMNNPYINNLFNNIYANINFLFLNNNNLEGYIDLSNFINLISLDIGNNNITNIKVNDNLKELVITNNDIILLPNNINLVRLECSENKIINIPNIYSDLELLYCNNNNIIHINRYPKLRKLVIHDNPLNQLEVSPEILYLDISVTPLTNLSIFPNLDHLVANSCKIKDIPYISSLRTLELINTPISRIKFYPNIETILCSVNLTKYISSKYSNIYNISLKNNSVICIGKI